MDMFGKKVGASERESLELAEASREEEWARVSFVRELFQGAFLWPLVYPYPEQSPEDRKTGDDYLEKIEKVLKEKLDPDEVDETGIIPKECIDALFEIGAFAIKIPKGYDGLGFSKVNYGRIMHLVSSYCGSTAVLLSAHQSIGVPQPLLEFGTEEQKKKYLPRFRKGAISAFALTEPHAGSDPRLMSTTAVPIDDGKHFIINGEKLWCTNGTVADIIVVMALTPPKVTGGKERKQYTAFIVETNTPGFEIVHRCRFMGLNGIQNGLLRFKDVKVPAENIILGEGEGLRLAFRTLNTGRLTMPAAVTGMSKWALSCSRRWSKEREQWGMAIGKHEAVASKLSTMAAQTFASDAVTWLVTHMAEQKKVDIRLEAAMAKLFCTESSWRVIDEALQIRAGRGYERSTSLKARGEADTAYPIERVMRDARINLIIEGTSEIMHLFITREALDPHLNHMKCFFNPKSTIAQKIQGTLKLICHYALWYPKMWLPVIGLARYTRESVKLNKHMVYAKRRSKKMARSLFHHMAVHMQALAHKQNLVARYVEIGTELFAMAATCSFACQKIKNDQNGKEAEQLADLFCRQARRRIEKYFKELRCNDDKLGKTVAKNIMDDKYTWLEDTIIT